MALKFKPIVVTADLICVKKNLDRFISVYKSDEPVRLLRLVSAFLEFCPHEYIFKERFSENVVKQCLLFYKMPAVHVYWFSVRRFL